MDALELIGHLRRVPLFSRLTDTQLESVAAIVQKETYPRGSRLATAGQAGRAFHYILSGEALVRAVQVHGRLRPVGYLQAGNYFGVTSLLLGEPHDSTVEAKTDLVALVIYRADLERLLQQNPDLENQLVLPQEVSTKRRHEHFDWLGAGEVVVFVGRRHWFALARSLLLPTLALITLGALLPASLAGKSVTWWIAAAAILLVAYALAWTWYWIDWHNDYFVVTTQRAVHRELVLFLYEARHEAPLHQVQDVTVKRGRLGQIFGFGDAIIQTAAKSGIGAIVFDHLHKPEEAKQAVFQQTYRSQAGARETERETVCAELKRRLQWATPQELAAQGQMRTQTPEPAAVPDTPQGQPQRSRSPRRGGLRLVPPIREQEGGRITWRKHWIFLVRRALQPALATLALALFLIAYLLGHMPFLPAGSLGVVLGMLVLGLAAGGWLWWQVTDWGNDVYIVTEDRLIDIEKRPLLGPEERRETTLDRVQNVSLVIPGALATLLNYGNVDIDTAGGEGQFTFSHVMAPHEVQREIMRRVSRYRERRSQLESQRHRGELADWFAAYENLRQERQEPPEPPSDAAPEGAT